MFAAAHSRALLGSTGREAYRTTIGSRKRPTPRKNSYQYRRIPSWIILEKFTWEVIFPKEPEP